MRHSLVLIGLATLAAAAPTINMAHDGEYKQYASYVPYAGYNPYPKALEKEAAKMGMANMKRHIAMSHAMKNDDIIQEKPNPAMMDATMMRHVDEKRGSLMPAADEMDKKKPGMLPDQWYSSYTPYKGYGAYGAYGKGVEAEGKEVMHEERDE